MLRRIITALLLLSLLLPVFASCGDGEDTSSRTGGTDESGWYSDLDFSGMTLTVSQSICIGNRTEDNAIANAEKYTRGPSAVGSDEVLNLCYNRNRETAADLNLKIRYIETDWIYNEIEPQIALYALAQTPPADIVINDNYAAVQMTMNGYLYNAKSKEAGNYFDFSHESWYPEYMAGMTISDDALYALAGDYFIDVIRSAHCLYVNTDYFETACGDAYESIDDFYAMVSGGGWTYDELALLAEMGWESTSREDTANLNDAHIGFFTENRTPFYAFAFTSGVSMLEKQGNTYAFKDDTEELASFAEALYDLITSNGVVVYPQQGTLEKRYTPFTDGKTLFIANYWLGTLEFDPFYEMENKAVVVYPKWTPETEYRTYVHDTAEIGYIMRNTTKFSPVSAYLQLINERSTDVLQHYYQTALKYKYNTQPGGAIQMMDIIHDTIMSPFEQYIVGQQLDCDIFHLINETVVKAGTPDRIVGEYTAKRYAAEGASKIDELLRRFAAVEEN